MVLAPTTINNSMVQSVHVRVFFRVLSRAHVVNILQYTRPKILDVIFYSSTGAAIVSGLKMCSKICSNPWVGNVAASHPPIDSKSDQHARDDINYEEQLLVQHTRRVIPEDKPTHYCFIRSSSMNHAVRLCISSACVQTKTATAVHFTRHEQNAAATSRFSHKTFDRDKSKVTQNNV